MSLIFNDDQIKCPKCGSNLFEEKVIHTLIEKEDRFKNKYYEKDESAYDIVCIKCGHLLSSSKESIIRK